MKKITLIRFKIILIYTIALIFSGIAMYYSIPFILNYGNFTYNTSFDKNLVGLYFYEQIILVSVLTLTIFDSLLFIIIKDLGNYKKYKDEFDKTNSLEIEKKLNKIRNICLNLPNITNLLLLLIMLIGFILSLVINSLTLATNIKMMFLIFGICFTFITIAHTPASVLLNKFLLYIENYNLPKKTKSTFKNMILQLLPLTIVGVVITFLSFASLYDKSKGETINKIYNIGFEEISKSNVNSYDELLEELQKINLISNNDFRLILDNEFNLLYSESELNDYFFNFAKEFGEKNNYTIYDNYSVKEQSILYPITVENNLYYIGIHYDLYADNLSFMIVIRLFVVGLAVFICVFLYTRIFSINLKKLTNNLIDLYHEKNFNKKAIVTSADDFGEITHSINILKGIGEKNVKTTKENTNRLMEKERLSSLGALIGSISHNLKTPIMSISGAVEGLDDLIKEYDSSIGDPEVTSQDNHDIAKEMRQWSDKISDHLSYMSDVINTVRSQVVYNKELNHSSFTVEEVINKLTILMNHELENSSVNLILSINVDPTTTVKGNVSSLVQVLENIISNSVQAYDNSSQQNITLSVYKKDHNIIFSITDFAGGIPQKVEDKLFKEMITTKGKNGSGLGLFMSYSNIKANFNGYIEVDTKRGIGSEFKIIIPL